MTTPVDRPHTPTSGASPDFLLLDYVFTHWHHAPRLLGEKKLTAVAVVSHTYAKGCAA
jgi:hypothetical protein